MLETSLVSACSFRKLMLMYRTTKKTNVELEVLVDSAGQRTAQTYTIMFSSSGAADEFKKLFKQVS